VNQIVSFAAITGPTDETDPDGWNAMLTAQGSLSLHVQSAASTRITKRVSYANDNILTILNFILSRRLICLIRSADLATPMYVSGNLLTLGALGNRYARSVAPGQLEVDSMQTLLNLVSAPEYKATQIRKVAAYFRAVPDAMNTVIAPIFSHRDVTRVSIQRLFALLSAVNHPMYTLLFRALVSIRSRSLSEVPMRCWLNPVSLRMTRLLPLPQ
jgi:hypothetical protein